MKSTKRQYGTGSVIKLKGCRFWYVTYRVDGRMIRESSRTESKMVAEKLLQKRLGEAGLGMAPEQDVKHVSYESCRDAWLASNKKGYSAMKPIDAFFKNKRAISITTDTLREYIAKRRAEGVADSTIRRGLNNLRAILNQARKEGKLRLSDIPHFPMAMLKELAPRKGFVDPPQFEKLLAALPENLRPLILFIYFTGCRVGAATRIEWSMVERDCSAIHLPGEITKSGEPLALPLTGNLKPLAEKLRKAFRHEGTVFDATNLRKEWNKACVATKLGTVTGLKRTGLTVHDLRRSAVRNLVRAGVSEDVAMKISGHKTRSVFSRYNIVDTSDVEAALEKVGTYAKVRV
jgi:integrase